MTRRYARKYDSRRYNKKSDEKKGLTIGHMGVIGLAGATTLAALLRPGNTPNSYVAEQFKSTPAITRPIEYNSLVDMINENAKHVRPKDYKDYLETSYEQVARRWKGTRWNMGGHSLEPGRDSKIACGYFQIRTAEALGLEYNLNELGFQTITKRRTEWLSTKRVVEATADKSTVSEISKNYLPAIRQYIRKNRYDGIDYFLQNSNFDGLSRFVREQGYKDIKHYIKRNGLSKLEAAYTFNLLEEYLNQYGDGAYSLALDKQYEGHVLTLIKKGDDLTIFHSSRAKGEVVEEDARKVLPWIDPQKYYIGKIFTENTLYRFLNTNVSQVASSSR